MPLVTHVGSATNARYSGLEGIAAPADRIRRLHVPAGGVVVDLGRGVRAPPGTQARHHRDARQLVPHHRRRARRPVGLLRRPSGTSRSTRRCSSRCPDDRASTWPRTSSTAPASPHPTRSNRPSLHGNATQLLWGSDYPHLEGTFVNPEGRDTPSVTRLALRHTFCALVAGDTLRMVGGNAIDVYGLDADALQAVADDIGAPTLDELATPIDAVPEGRASPRSAPAPAAGVESPPQGLGRLRSEGPCRRTRARRCHRTRRRRRSLGRRGRACRARWPAR